MCGVEETQTHQIWTNRWKKTNPIQFAEKRRGGLCAHRLLLYHHIARRCAFGKGSIGSSRWISSRVFEMPLRFWRLGDRHRYVTVACLLAKNYHDTCLIEHSIDMSSYKSKSLSCSHLVRLLLSSSSAALTYIDGYLGYASDVRRGELLSRAGHCLGAAAETNKLCIASYRVAHGYGLGSKCLARRLPPINQLTNQSINE